MDLVIFDCDGVLVDSEMIASRIFAQHLTEHGYPLTAEESRERFTGWSLRSAKAFVEKALGRPLPDDFLETLAAKDRAAMTGTLQPIAGIHEAVAKLAVPSCVASSGGPDKIRYSLRLCGLIEVFEPNIFSAWQVANGKPAPDLFLFAAERMRTPPARCVVVEDSVAGVRAGKSAGMTVLGFCGGAHCGNGHDARLRAEGASLAFHDMRQLPDIVAAL